MKKKIIFVVTLLLIAGLTCFLIFKLRSDDNSKIQNDEFYAVVRESYAGYALVKPLDEDINYDLLSISVKDLKTYSVADIRNLISNDNAYVAIIDENNLKNESDKVISWCKDKFIKNDLMRYEEENQEHLKEINTILDKFDENLEKILKERK